MRPLNLDVRSRFVLFSVIAALAAPIVLALFFVVTTPSGTQIGIGYLCGGYYALAHLVYWPPALATRYIARRTRFTSMPRAAAVMGMCSLVVALVVGSAAYVLNVKYTLGAVARDALGEALASAAGFILYRAIVALRAESVVEPAGS
jgi:hypothetical protein